MDLLKLYNIINKIKWKYINNKINNKNKIKMKGFIVGNLIVQTQNINILNSAGLIMFLKDNKHIQVIVVNKKRI